MQIEQCIRERGVWTTTRRPATPCDPHLVLVFGPTHAVCDPATWQDLRARFAGARIVAASTAGEIGGVRVLDDSLVATAIHFAHATLAIAGVGIAEPGGGRALGGRLARALPRGGLVHVLVLSDGLQVNGSELVAGLAEELGAGVAITGGLAGDGSRFARTAVCLDGPEPSAQVVAIGLYGDRLRVGYGSLGGWDPFGPERMITRADGNVLYELDGEPALDLYQRYLGAHAAELPASGLLFPLAIRESADDREPAIVRTILSFDAAARSLTFAADIPRGYRARLMRANFERLVDGASGAARASVQRLADAPAELALLISCVGRKLVLKQRVEEEVEAVAEVLGGDPAIAGFYSYGELSPVTHDARCALHNQTMTITTLVEV